MSLLISRIGLLAFEAFEKVLRLHLIMHRMKKAAHWAIFTQRLKKVVKNKELADDSMPPSYKIGEEQSYCCTKFLSD